MPGPSYGVWVSPIFVVPPCVLPSFDCHLWSGQKFPVMQGARGGHVPPASDAGAVRAPPKLCDESLSVFTVTYTICPGQQPSSLPEGTAINLPFVVQCILNVVPSTLPFPQSRIVGVHSAPCYISIYSFGPFWVPCKAYLLSLRDLY